MRETLCIPFVQWAAELRPRNTATFLIVTAFLTPIYGRLTPSSNVCSLQVVFLGFKQNKSIMHIIVLRHYSDSAFFLHNTPPAKPQFWSSSTQVAGEIPLQLQWKIKIWKIKWEEFYNFTPSPPVSSFHNFCPFEHEILKTTVTSNLRIPFLDVVSDMKYGHWCKIIQVRIVILVLWGLLLLKTILKDKGTQAKNWSKKFSFCITVK